MWEVGDRSFRGVCMEGVVWLGVSGDGGFGGEVFWLGVV